MIFEIAVTKRLGIQRLSLDITSDAPVTALFGRSGIGKTTLLNLVAGVRRPDRGRIVVAGEVLFDRALKIDVPPERRRAGYIFQDGRLFPHLSIRQNLLYGFRLRPPETHILNFDETVDFLGIAALLDRPPRTLSGGEAQRVAIGRALLSGPRFLVMDEPLAFLDQDRKNEILAIVERLRVTLKLPILYVTHERGELERLGARVIEMPELVPCERARSWRDAFS